uniref:Uncharacterized protein n=1 Tax=Candidatus Aschnera chinzeii TaxID=1485666 RepID=A0AAT9G583_9ENTR|nr:MAG: hypothetical protein ACHINZ_5450 [Candidatus Aschnera chinzeii]
MAFNGVVFFLVIKIIGDKAKVTTKIIPGNIKNNNPKYINNVHVNNINSILGNIRIAKINTFNMDRKCPALTSHKYVITEDINNINPNNTDIYDNINTLSIINLSVSDN